MLSSHITSFLVFVVILCLADGSQSQSSTPVTPSPSVTTSTDTVTTSNVQQTTATTSQPATPPSQSSSTGGAAINPSSTSTASSASSTPSTPSPPSPPSPPSTPSPPSPPSTPSPPSKTLVEFSCKLTQAWNESYGNSSTDAYQNLYNSAWQALKVLYDDSSMYGAVELKLLDFIQEDEIVKMRANVTFDGLSSNSLLDVFSKKWKSGDFISQVEVSKCEATPIGVTIGFKVKDGCETVCSDSESSAGQEFTVVQTCKANHQMYSCKGLTAEFETKECTKYCKTSNSAIMQVSFTVLVMALVVSFSQML